MGQVLKRPQALKDLEGIFDYIAGDSPASAARFIAAAEADFRKLASMSGLGVRRRFPRARVKGIRSWPIKGFENYLVFYTELSPRAGIEVVRVLHGARDLGRLL